MIPETKIVMIDGDEKFVTGYFLTIEQLARLVRDFQADCFDGFVSNDVAYLESKLKEIEHG
jgi:hypothetical protein